MAYDTADDPSTASSTADPENTSCHGTAKQNVRMKTQAIAVKSKRAQSRKVLCRLLTGIRVAGRPAGRRAQCCLDQRAGRRCNPLEAVFTMRVVLLVEAIGV